MEYIVDSFLNVRISDVMDVLIVAFIIYKFIVYVKETRAKQLFKGVVIVAALWAVSEFFGLFMLNFIIEYLMTLGIIAIVILFQPELRYALEKLGRGKVISGTFQGDAEKNTEDMIEELISSVKYFSDTRTGALIVIERETGLADIVRTGEMINSRVSDRLMRNIFFKNAPLHDGAMVIKDNTIVAASCLLPLSSNGTISRDLGTRHRAALGLSEQSDAFIIIVSEETGVISVAIDNVLSRYVDIAGLSSLLRSKFLDDKKKSALRTLLGGIKREKIK